MEYKICENCKQEFQKPKWQSKNSFFNRKYCSQSCACKGTVNSRNTPEAREKQRNKLKGRQFSEEHRVNLRKALVESEKVRANYFKKGKDNPAYGRNQTGEANHNWKGGKTNSNQKLRNSPEYKVWRTTCMERDNFKCVDCGTKGYLQVHHIQPISTHPELIWETSNGKTVCVSCHEKIHGRFIGKFKQTN